MACGGDLSLALHPCSGSAYGDGPAAKSVSDCTDQPLFELALDTSWFGIKKYLPVSQQRTHMHTHPALQVRCAPVLPSLPRVFVPSPLVLLCLSRGVCVL